MPFKSFDIFSVLASFFGKTFGTCARMQRHVNRLHTSLNKGSVKRPGLDT